MPTPYKLAKLSADDRKTQIETWTADAKKHWSVEKGELVNDGKGAYLTTDREYGDIELLIEYKTVAQADSGIYLRATPQVQIWDTTKRGRQMEYRRGQRLWWPVQQRKGFSRPRSARPRG